MTDALKNQIAEKAEQDPTFRAALEADAAAAIAEAFGDELSDEDLDAIAGGAFSYTFRCG